MIRKLDPIRFPNGEMFNILPKTFNIWRIRVVENFLSPTTVKKQVHIERVVPIVAPVDPLLPTHSYNRSFKPQQSFRPVYMGHSDEDQDEDDGYMGPPTSATSDVLNKLLTSRVVALDVECFSGIGGSVDQYAMLVLLYGDDNVPHEPEMLIDRRWIMYGVGIKANIAYEQILSNGITSTQRGLAAVRVLPMLRATGSSPSLFIWKSIKFN